MLATLKRRASGLPWGLLAVEGLAIALSVMLGFAATGWREDRREDALRHETLANFRAELEANRAAAAEAIPYHEATLKRTQGVLFGGGLDTLQHISRAMRAVGWRGPGGAYLARTAFRAAEATGTLGLLDFETAGAVTAVYEMQDALEEYRLHFLTQTAFHTSTFDPANVEEALWVMLVYFESTLNTELTLLPQYERALAAVGRALGEPVPAAERPAADSTAAPAR